uniref:Uncharacterized protein n=1 Tax=viral metagenome TaxID=1070528 RepID=A0A6C0KBW0_9ZZZZ
MSSPIKVVVISVLISMFISMVINVVVPYISKPYATQTKPPNGAIDQIIYVFVHQAQVPIASTLIIAIIVAASVFLSYLI